MSQRLRCPRGHHWDVLLRADGRTDVFRANCPVCGEAPLSAPASITTDPSGPSPTVPAAEGAPPLVGGSGRGFWIAMLLVAVVGLVGVLALPLIFPQFDWFGLVSPLRDEKTVIVQPGTPQRVQWDDPRVEKATITVRSPGNPVNVFVVTTGEVEEALRELSTGNAPSGCLATRTWVEAVSLEIAPGKRPFAVLLTTSARKAEVRVSVRGR